MRVEDFESIRVKLASPEEILNWSHGEVTKPETINYRTQRAEKEGLFCEKIFGPVKDYECYCGKYKKIRYKGVTCDHCGVEVTKAITRRERMGHIKLATPVSHIWFLRGVPSRMGMILDIPMQQLERVIYFTAYIITKVNEDAKKRIFEEIEKEYKIKLKDQNSTINPTKSSVKKISELKAAKERAKEEVLRLKPLRILSEIEYHNLSLKYGEIFEAGTGAETLRKIFEKIDLKKEIEKIKKQIEETSMETIIMTKKKILTRLNLFQAIEKAKIRPEWMFLTVLPVLPPELRPMVQLDGGRYASADLNDLYRRVINRNNRLKYLLEIDAPEVIVRNEKRMLQEAVDALIDNGMRKSTMTQATTGGKRLLKSLADVLKGKQGRFRQNLLGKRVDYSGRSVIVVGPELLFHQVGLPKKMALELFKPFVIKEILDKELAYNVRTASKLIEQETAEVWACLERIVKDKLVLLNRAPTLHRLGIQAFQPILIEGETIRVHPMICKAFNADFDGDQMAVHLPLSAEAQKESREIMLSTLNLLKPATGTPVVTVYQDISFGCYWLTRIKLGAKGEGKIFSSQEEALLACEFGEIDIQTKIKIPKDKIKNSLDNLDNSNFIETSTGRIIFNQILPKDFPFQNSEIKTKDLERIIREIIEKYNPPEDEDLIQPNNYSQLIEETLDKIKELGFKYSTLSGLSWGMDDLIIPPEKEKIIEKAEKEVAKVEEYFKKNLLSKEEKSGQIIEIWTRTKLEIEKQVPQILPKEGTVSSIVNAGARGSWLQPVQMTGMKGLVINPSGQTIELPVKNSYKEGLDPLEYFISTHGARKGTTDTALRTATAGYLTRRLIDVTHDVIIEEKDCGDEKGIEISLVESEETGQNPFLKIVGRISLEKVKTKKGKILVQEKEIIDWQKGEKIIKSGIEKLRVRSPLSCKLTWGICQKCYGWDLCNNRLVKLGTAVGIIASQAIGEPGTQLTMRTFHTGGVVGGEDITSGLPRIQEIFEARSPNEKAEISQVEGKVLSVIPEKGIIKIKPEDKNSKSTKTKTSKKAEIIEYKIPTQTAILVKPGEKVKKGQQISKGNLDLKELFKIAGQEICQRHIIEEIQKIYVSQGVTIHDKHVEIITRQMFSRVKIKEPGRSSFTTGEIVEKSKFLEENAKLKKEEKAKGIPILLGISRVALTTDSFLSAASFQETSRILIKSSLEGKEDKLRGLKENVIIGKLIPVGTGFRKKIQ